MFSPEMSAEAVEKQREAFMEQFLQFASGTFNIFSIYIGDQLGFYRSLAEGGPSTAAELAERTNTHERYVREWLEQQTVAGILDVEDENQEAGKRRFRLPPAMSNL